MRRGSRGRDLRRRARTRPHRHPQVWCCAHSGDHNPGLPILRESAIDDFLQIRMHRREVLAAQHVVRPELQDQYADRLAEQPVDASQSARGGVATHAGVDHAETQHLLVDPPLDQRGEGLIGGNSQTCSEAGPEEGNDRPSVSRLRRHCRAGAGSARGAAGSHATVIARRGAYSKSLVSMIVAKDSSRRI